MRQHRNCVTDPLARSWWRDYQRVCADGNPIGLSFVEYIAQRVGNFQTAERDAPWYPASCGHSHAWGVPCGDAYLT